MTPLSTKQIAFLRSRGHRLEPRLQLGKKGPNDGFRRELEQLLASEELVKIKLGRRVDVDLPGLAGELGATLVHHVGRTVVLYRAAAEPKLKIP
jgi:RNA-binding protein YhbY